MDTTIRNCEIADFEEIFPLLQQLWPGHPMDALQTKKVFERAVNSTNQFYICAAHNAQVIGLCSLTIKNNLWVQGNLCHVDELVVAEQCRGKSIGRDLLKRATEIAAEHHCKRMELDSSFHRVEAHQFYLKLRFENRAYLFSKVIKDDNNIS